MATYNGERYIRQQLDSILNCLSPDDELIASDDGSSDGTLDILRGYAKNSSVHFRIIDGPHRGVIANFDNALRNANGEVLFLSDQDDVWHSDKVDKVMNAFASSDCSVVVHDATLVDGNGKPLGQTLYERRQSRPGFLKNITKNSYVGCCMAIRRDLLPKILPFPENVEMHDWWIGLMSDATSRSTFISDQLIDYRRHGDNASRMNHYPVPKMIAIRAVMLGEIGKRLVSLRSGDRS